MVQSSVFLSWTLFLAFHKKTSKHAVHYCKFIHHFRAYQCLHVGTGFIQQMETRWHLVPVEANIKTYWHQRSHLISCVREWSDGEDKQSQDSCHLKSCQKVIYYTFEICHNSWGLYYYIFGKSCCSLFCEIRNK